MAIVLYMLQDDIRMLVSGDLDLSMSLYLQFSLRFDCDSDGAKRDIPVQHSVLVQFSNNGGILWQFLQELHSSDAAESK